MSFKFNLKKKIKGKFAVRMRSYALKDKQDAGKPDVEYIEKTLPESQWYRYGFTSQMTYKQASELLKSLNSQSKVKEIQEKKARFKHVESEEKKELLKSAYLPAIIVEAFERKLKNDSYAPIFEKSKSYFHWKTAMRVIAEIELSPEEWSENKRIVLKEMEGFAPSTVSKLLSLMNAYGVFYSKRMGNFFERIPSPKGKDAGHISDKYMDKTGGKTKEAKGVDLDDMISIKVSEELTAEEINWCIACLGLALRPGEMDMAAKRDKKTLTIGKSLVKVYQSKLVSLPQNKRFKEVQIKRIRSMSALNF